MADRTNKRNTGRHATRARIHKLLTEIENRFESESGKASVGDYIRLLQLERELEEHEGSRESERGAGPVGLGKGPEEVIQKMHSGIIDKENPIQRHVSDARGYLLRQGCKPQVSHGAQPATLR